jgi:hypothetical protein
MRIVCLVAALALVAGCKSTPEAKADAASPVAASATFLRLKREPCFGRCPAYVVTVSSSGAVEFDGETAVLVKGKSTATLSAEQLAAIKARLEQCPFEQWKAAYDDRTMTDMASVELTWNGRTIRHYLGDGKAPQELTKLEDDLDALIGTAQWVNGKGAPAQ